MIPEASKKLLKSCAPYYLAGILWVVCMKYFYSHAGSDDLLWILSPTARWVRILGGLSFEYQSGLGYVNHFYRFVIAASCSGIQFMIILNAMLLFSFLHRLKSRKGRMLWTLGALGGSYVLTILINSIRILTAIHLPVLFSQADLWNAWLTPHRLHAMIGVAVYFSALLICYLSVDRMLLHLLKSGPATVIQNSLSETDLCPALPVPLRTWGLPLFWYLLVLLVLPLLNGAIRKDCRGFTEYTIMILAVCSVVIGIFLAAGCAAKHFRQSHPVRKRKGSQSW